MTGPSQGGTTGDSGRSSTSFAANHAAASYPLAESGILFDMVGSDQNVPGGILASSQEKADADTVPESSLVAAVATAACGVLALRTAMVGDWRRKRGGKGKEADEFTRPTQEADVRLLLMAQL